MAAALTKLSQTEAKMATMQSALESTQTELFELKNKFDEEGSAKYATGPLSLVALGVASLLFHSGRGAELEILMTDLERTNQVCGITRCTVAILK